jgi:hypothetical protein
MEAGLTIDEAAQLFEVCKRTVRYWDSGQHKPPKAVFLYLSIRTGHLGFLGSKWQGFRILSDCIVSPENDHIWHYEIRAINYLYMAAGLKRYRINRMLEAQPLKKKAEIKTKPEPDNDLNVFAFRLKY